LEDTIKGVLIPQAEQSRLVVSNAGTAFIRERHSFDARVQELFGFIRNRLVESKQLSESVSFKYIGRMKESFSAGKGMRTGIQYDYEPNHVLLVHKLDAEQFLHVVQDSPGNANETQS